MGEVEVAEGNPASCYLSGCQRGKYQPGNFDSLEVSANALCPKLLQSLPFNLIRSHVFSLFTPGLCNLVSARLYLWDLRLTLLPVVQFQVSLVNIQSYDMGPAPFTSGAFWSSAIQILGWFALTALNIQW